MHKAYAVESDDAVRSAQPNIAILSLRDRVDECGRKSVFVRPDCMGVFGKRLLRSERVGRKQKHGAARSREEGTYQIACQRRSHGHTHLILPSEQESKNVEFG